mmetsp:Transcript_22801/g.64090  ORF Transcript_22801/g.64090 Transcript_22801/m.64090 type:complete len:639 (+) Transcript_22801:182-2098(+)|eukprot:CAMPEP_0119131992 /NCGR_PEP_ID=MMETSP1310-20130426/11094_1 /TAXON_ID=464262 /ORGANISM="Genus nov. species nov., Strain RCC2339" /LENGTH=638 /DNA_ID=CAMNT_0007122595 /DNA_START=160 /DNA_END=2076 /DNA_ORIENTATION=-
MLSASILSARGGAARLAAFPTASSASASRFFSRSQITLGHSRIASVNDFIDEMATLCKPNDIHFCTGSEEENNQLLDQMVTDGVIEKLNSETRPGCYLARSDPRDVARVEKQTYICSRQEGDAGPTNNWQEPGEWRNFLTTKFDGCMKGRTMYVMPFSMGPVGSPLSKTGYQVTDSPFVVANTRIMTRLGSDVDAAMTDDGEYVRCLHSVGHPLEAGDKGPVWPCNDEKYISHFPETREIWSYGSGYGGNALLGKKCFALRIASVLARDQGWLAEHMLILGLTNPKGEKKYIAAAFPSACGKTNLAMLEASLPGWKVECVGDDIAWMKFGADGQLYAINPENGFFGVAPGTSFKTNAHAMETIQSNSLFTNVARTDDNDVYWEGMGSSPSHLIDWKGNDWTPESGTPSAHPNARFTTPITQCPVVDPNFESQSGVPISAILFGGRRASTIPLVHQARSWKHGTFMGSIVASEQTAAAEGKVGSLRHDPFAMLPFCGYNMADYFGHWLSMERRSPVPKNLPKIFYVNWFRKGHDGSFLWPGFGENIRVLEWIFKRCKEDVTPSAIAEDTPIGFLPKRGAINTDGLDVTDSTMRELLRVDTEGWASDISSIEDYMSQFGNRLPVGITDELNSLKANLGCK